MNESAPLFPSVAAGLAAFGIAFELIRFLFLAATRRSPSPFLSFFTWALRPWTIWALFNLVYRWGWAPRLNNYRTFPFFANPWIQDEPFRDALLRIVHSPGLPVWGWVVPSLLIAILLLLAWTLRRPSSARIWPALFGLYLLAIALPLSQASLPDGAWNEEGPGGSLLVPWNDAGSTMLYAMPRIQSTRDYLERFEHIQPSLKMTVHGLSHPPAASLSLFWIGKVMGVKGKDIRLPAVRLRYAIGLTAAGALNVFVLFLIGRALFNAKTGFLAATLWATAPSVSAYITFAQDSVYALFFNLAFFLIWRTVQAERLSSSLRWGTLLGADFFMMVMMNYSWCLMTTLFVLFLWAARLRTPWTLRETVLRAGWPLALMTLLTALVLLTYHLDYWAIYRFSNEYVSGCYARLNTPYRWIMALVGGQIDWLLMLGSLTCSAFFATLVRFRKHSLADPRILFLALALAIYALPLLFGPKCLKLETTRCWIWMASLPLAFGAHRLLQMPRLFVYGAPAVSVLTYMILRLFVEFIA